MSLDYLCVARTAPCFRISRLGSGALRLAPAAPCDEARASHARIPVLSPGSTPRVRAQSQRYRPGGPRAPTASRRTQTPAAAADVDSPRPLLLDQPPASVAPMVGRAAHHETGDRGPVVLKFYDREAA